MTLYERTNEFRLPNPGEWFESEDGPALVSGNGGWVKRWILRRVATPAAETAPTCKHQVFGKQHGFVCHKCGATFDFSMKPMAEPAPAAEPQTRWYDVHSCSAETQPPEPDYRDGEQTANVVRVLEWIKGITWQNSPHVRAAVTEAIRIVRAHDKAREYVQAKWDERGHGRTDMLSLLALLDGTHAEGT